ncbi:hypothetical protein [Limobrevibacterium gyesilva]|uniref:HTH luxR-type domain-containing protein n=1 Tax=Limobrevibacterium gyesilva TaxID=2991712 RepID=A0AA41YM19_9PROT|nr:hypothetical protein [Limobrevibacterium gyesilva]MCW3476376.1 hypothetical protein [Limobrevibacterium gyesilva]
MTPFPIGTWIDLQIGATAVVFANDPEVCRPPAAAALAALYRLTPAEARLLEALLQGERVSEFAERVGIRTDTADGRAARAADHRGDDARDARCWR